MPDGATDYVIGGVSAAELALDPSAYRRDVSVPATPCRWANGVAAPCNTVHAHERTNDLGHPTDPSHPHARRFLTAFEWEKLDAAGRLAKIVETWNSPYAGGDDYLSDEDERRKLFRLVWGELLPTARRDTVHRLWIYAGSTARAGVFAGILAVLSPFYQEWLARRLDPAWSPDADNGEDWGDFPFPARWNPLPAETQAGLMETLLTEAVDDEEARRDWSTDLQMSAHPEDQTESLSLAWARVDQGRQALIAAVSVYGLAPDLPYYQWGGAVNFSEAPIYWPVGGFTARDLSGHLGVDFGEAGGLLARTARVYARVGNLVTEMWQGCGSGGPAIYGQPPNNCLFSTQAGVNDPKGVPLRDEEGELVQVEAGAPVWDECWFAGLGVKTSTMYAAYQWIESGNAGWELYEYSGYRYARYFPPSGLTDVRASLEYDPIPGAYEWLAADGLTEVIGGAVYMMDAEMFGFVNDGGEGAAWRQRDNWREEPPPLAKTKRLLPSGYMTVYPELAPTAYCSDHSMNYLLPEEAMGDETGVVLTHWSRCGKGHACLTNAFPAMRYRAPLPTWFLKPFYPNPVPGYPLPPGAAAGDPLPFGCPALYLTEAAGSGRCDDMPAKLRPKPPGEEVITRGGLILPGSLAVSAPVPKSGKCLKWDQAAGQCGLYGPEAVCDECEHSVSAPYDEL
jgi:hypothetical protein